jgi:hypothetical protein
MSLDFRTPLTDRMEEEITTALKADRQRLRAGEPIPLSPLWHEWRMWLAGAIGTMAWLLLIFFTLTEM